MNVTGAEQPAGGSIYLGLRLFAWSTVAVTASFLISNFLSHALGWPGMEPVIAGSGPDTTGIDHTKAWIQLLIYPGSIIVIAAWIFRSTGRHLYQDAEMLSAVAAYIVRVAFWAVFLIGLADMVVSFLRVEDLLPDLVGNDLTRELGRPIFRGVYLHYPLILISMIVALFVRSIGFSWLALLVVMAEFQIVVARFIFSYEQAFMGDLVRFWYASLFLFASAYTLIYEGHVRVDVIYAHFSRRGKAWSNLIGSALLGIPLCWIILLLGMSTKASIITSPLTSFEISQSGYGMYVKYLMAGFLLVYAVSMMVQFASYFLRSAAVLRGESVPELKENLD